MVSGVLERIFESTMLIQYSYCIPPKMGAPTQPIHIALQCNHNVPSCSEHFSKVIPGCFILDLRDLSSEKDDDSSDRYRSCRYSHNNVARWWLSKPCEFVRKIWGEMPYLIYFNRMILKNIAYIESLKHVVFVFVISRWQAFRKYMFCMRLSNIS